MAKENLQKDGERLEQIESTLGKTEMFVEKNKKTIVYAVIAVVVVILAIIGVKKFVLEPQELEAEQNIYAAQMLMEDNNFELALKGNENTKGFIYIIDEYGNTKTGNLAKYYAGICYLNLGDFENAVKSFNDYDGDDLFTKPLAMSMLGDAYMGLDNLAEAAKCYEKAAKETKNIATSPWNLMKAGYTYEMLENYDKALEMYNIVKTEYPQSTQAIHIMKNIGYVEAKMAK